MRIFGAASLAAGILLALVAPAEARSVESVHPGAELTVSVFNYARVPRGVLGKAQEFAAKTFRQAGVEIHWVDASSADAREWTEARNGSRLVIRIIPDSMIGGWATQCDALGFALVPADGREGYLAGAFYERIERVAPRLGGDPALILGYVIAHELGHLLLGANSHFRSGLMSYPFERREWLLASRGRLRFTPPQVERILERLRALAALSFEVPNGGLAGAAGGFGPGPSARRPSLGKGPSV
jgi:hypothetical protein